MTFVARVLLESPFLLGVLSFLLFGVTLFVRQRMESPGARRYSIPAILLFIVALFVIQGLVETEGEVIARLIEEFVAAVEAEDVERAGLLISANYAGEAWDRAQFIERLRAWLDVVDIRDARFQRRDVTTKGNAATLKLGIRATVRIREQAGAMHWGAWTIDWIRSPQGWRITRITPDMIDGQPIRSLRTLGAYVD